MKKILLLTLLVHQLCTRASGQQTQYIYLSGTDKNNTVEWNFFCTKGRKSGEWTTIPVPSHWEQKGFGNYAYGWEKNKSDEEGRYKYSFNTASDWKDKYIFIVFEGVMTDAEVKINGRLAGDVHQGGFYRFQYDISKLLKFGEANSLEVRVSKRSANASVEKAERDGDFWTFGGIYRPVYLKVVPRSFIDHTAIDARYDGGLHVAVFTKNATTQQRIEVQLQDLKGNSIGKPFSAKAQTTVKLAQRFNNIRTWNPEQPNLYQLSISLKDGATPVHTITQRFGFRTAELRMHDGFYVNGAKVILKGVNRHSSWPESGRTLSREIHLTDITLMKDMNMNAVRMSHYPPDAEFLDLCDSLGLFVIDELTGWQAAYDTAAGKKLLKEMILRDVNHPCVVMWANGNEGGWNRALDSEFALYDPQKRLVIHPWEKFNGTDTRHYPDFNYVINSVLQGDDVFFPTEFMHGLYDGGHGAGLDDFWNKMLQHPHFAGGFLWAFHDEGVARTDRNDSIDTHTNAAPDGIVGPHREKEGSYFAIKEIWSPVAILTSSIDRLLSDSIEIENRYLYTNIASCRFRWRLVSFPHPTDSTNRAAVLGEGEITSPSIQPGERGWLHLSLPKGVAAEALYLTAFDPYGNEIFTWSWPLSRNDDIPATSVAGNITAKEDDLVFALTCDSITYVFDKVTGYLQKIMKPGGEINLKGGPAPAAGKAVLKNFRSKRTGNAYVVEPEYDGEHGFTVRWRFEPGHLARLDYHFAVKAPVDFMGICFDYDEHQITGMRWLGRGPYRVWKNRLKGVMFGVWEKNYNNTITGESWQYPEFKGWHANVRWVKIFSKQSDFIIYTAGDDTFLQMMVPARPKGAFNENTSPPFPQHTIGFMHGISAIGTKFQPAEVMGPQSQKNDQSPTEPLKGTLWFDFR